MSVRHVAICILAVAGCGSPRTTSTTTTVVFDAPVEARRAGAARWRHWLERPSPRAFDGPTPAEMTTALAPVRPQLEACGEPVDLTVEFDRSGAISSIWGTAATTASYRACLQAATTMVRLAPFDRANVWVRYP